MHTAGTPITTGDTTTFSIEPEGTNRFLAACFLLIKKTERIVDSFGFMLVTMLLFQARVIKLKYHNRLWHFR